MIPDPDGRIELTPGLAARLCDRRAGLGADGVLRAVRATAGGGIGVPGADGADAAGGADGAAPAGADNAASGAEWFMDYRNADGSVAEMCGNGVRVFGRYLLDHELVTGPEFAVATRAGTRQVRAEPDGGITVDMGPPRLLGPGRAKLAGQLLDGLRVSLGNPHLACVVDGPLAEFDLSRPPETDDDQFPEGVNLELVKIVDPAHIAMVVYERGSGPTRSCGTGAVAAAAAAAVAVASEDGPGGDPAVASGGGAAAVPPGTWIVDVPGGRLRVTFDGATSSLSGPAVIVAEGELDEAWLSGKPVMPGQSGPTR
jgi:diaminopimelate epimerase